MNLSQVWWLHTFTWEAEFKGSLVDIVISRSARVRVLTNDLGWVHQAEGRAQSKAGVGERRLCMGWGVRCCQELACTPTKGVEPSG